MSLCLDKVETYLLSIYGKSEFTTSSPISVPNLPANKEKTQVTFYLKVFFLKNAHILILFWSYQYFSVCFL